LYPKGKKVCNGEEQWESTNMKTLRDFLERFLCKAGGGFVMLWDKGGGEKTWGKGQTPKGGKKKKEKKRTRGMKRSKPGSEILCKQWRRTFPKEERNIRHGTMKRERRGSDTFNVDYSSRNGEQWCCTKEG